MQQLSAARKWKTSSVAALLQICEIAHSCQSLDSQSSAVLLKIH